MKSIKLHHLATRCNDPSRPEFDGDATVDCSRKARLTYFAYPDGDDDDDVDDLCRRMRHFHLPPQLPLPRKDPHPPDCL